MPVSDGLSIGALARRTGLAVSAIRYYEDLGLVHPWRNAGGQRRFQRADIRRLSFIIAARNLGLSLARIGAELERLPKTRAPSRSDWGRVARVLQSELNQRIAHLQQMTDVLGGCIGCGCLSLEVCQLYNPKDQAATAGAGPRYLMGERPEPSAELRRDQPRKSP